MSRVVIAGGSGLVGQALATRLVAAGDDVVVLTRRPRAALLGHQVEWDGEHAGPWVSALEGARAVVNLCGESIAAGRWTAARKAVLRNSRIRPGALLAAAMQGLEVPPATFIQASGVGFYGTGDRERTEADGPGQDFLAELAADWEAASAMAPARRLIARFGVVLAASGGALPLMLLPFRLFAGGPLGAGTQWLSWIHLNDAARALQWLLDSDLTGAVNVTAPEAVTNEDFAATAARILRRPHFFRVPRPLMEIILGEQATLLCDGQRVLPERLMAAGFAWTLPDVEAALRDLVDPPTAEAG